MKTHLVVCEVFRDEIEAVAPPEMPRLYIEQGLHCTPAKMPAAIQEVIDALPADTELVLLAYGLCSNGVVGVTARKAPIIIPRSHDCISLLLGSRARYDAEFSACPGTYFITPGWVRYGETVLSAYRSEYLEKYGEEDALYIAREMLKSYERVALVDHGVGDLELAREHARELGRTFGLRYEEIPGSIEYIRRLIEGPWTPEEFIRLEPGQCCAAAPFLA